MRYRIAKRFLISNAIVLLFLYILLHYLMKDSLRQRTPHMEILDVPFNHSFSMGTGRILPLTVEYSLLLDNPTPEILSEFTTKQDIVFLNSSYSGYVVRFSEKNVQMALLTSLKHLKLYYGWQHNKEYMQIDKMFVVLGMDLVLRINKRKYCYRERSQCYNKSELVDEGWGGKSIGLWLSVYDDVLTVPDNQNIIYYNSHEASN
ncbi:hypothetical protein ACJMK2_008536 [Sinanodonta woodiana]|uniref:Uncharacterized protein n=1 Tax=Sinanodonta woodiana TaxID=1069815 RepID=A0ABD3VLX4_SINWO